MKNVIVVGCGAYMSSGYGCPGEWRCLKAATIGEGKFSKPANVTAFVRCECPGRATVKNMTLALKQSDVEVDAIHLSSCMVKPKPACPHASADEWAQMIEMNTGIPVVQETHDYH